jgi:diguanylate cyclase
VQTPPGVSEESLVARIERISVRGALKLAGWTLSGTLGCLGIALLYNWLSFRHMGEEALRQSLISATVLPIILAGPLFCYLTLKMRELAIANHRLHRLASTDALTACLNRGAFSAIVGEWLDTEPADTERTCALLVVDADHFKNINDNHGHDQGDEALKIIAAAIRSAVRDGDLVGRLGGEEFGVFLPGASEVSARAVAERIRISVSKSEFKPRDRRCTISVSVGCATLERPSDFSELFRVADERLYMAKRAGRNRVVAAHISENAAETARVLALH